MNEEKMLSAKDIVNNPQIVDKIEGKYQIIEDQSVTKFRLDNLNLAINIMAKKGWKCVSITAIQAGAAFGAVPHIWALMEKQSEP